MSFINNGKKKQQNEKLDLIDNHTDHEQILIDQEPFREESKPKKRATIFDQMESMPDQSKASTEPITWDPEPFAEQDSNQAQHTKNDVVTDTEEVQQNEPPSIEENDISQGQKQTIVEENHLLEEEEQPSPTETTTENPAGINEVKTEIVDLNSLIQDRFVSVDKQLHKLSNDFEAKLKYDQHKDKVIDNLHRELQMYKDNSFQERLTPIIMDLILTIDRTEKILKSLPQDEEFKKFIKVIKESIMDLEDILYKQGVEAYEEEGPGFDSNRQKVVKTVKTDNPELDKQIADRLGKGYERDERMIRKELVTVYVYEEAKASEE